MGPVITETSFMYITPELDVPRANYCQSLLSRFQITNRKSTQPYCILRRNCFEAISGKLNYSAMLGIHGAKFSL